MNTPDYDYIDLISRPVVKFTQINIPDSGVWLKLEEGIEEDNVLFRFTSAKITENGMLEYKIETATPEQVTERLYDYAAAILSNSLKEKLEESKR